MATPYAREVEIAIKAVEDAGRITLEYFQTDLAVEEKADRTPVTIADRSAEERLRADLARAFPDDGILGEEFGEQSGRSGRRWIVDPIDGTQSFIRGVPLYGVLLGLEERGTCVVGAVAFPALRLTLWAARGGGAFLNGLPIRVSRVSSLAQATVLAGDCKPEYYGNRYPGFQALLRRSARQRGWGDCYGHALVAMGRAEAMVDVELSAWDCAALVPIVEEAGGAFFDWDGNDTIYGGSGISTTAGLRPEVLRALRDGT